MTKKKNIFTNFISLMGNSELQVLIIIILFLGTCLIFNKSEEKRKNDIVLSFSEGKNLYCLDSTVVNKNNFWIKDHDVFTNGVTYVRLESCEIVQ